MPMANEGATWIMAYAEDTWDDVKLFAYRAEGDTVINGFEFKKIYYYDLKPNQFNPYLIRERYLAGVLGDDLQEKLVYGKLFELPQYQELYSSECLSMFASNSADNSLLINFNKSQGDSLRSCQIEEDEQGTVIVIDSIEFLYGKDRRVLQTEFGLQLIEGIGFDNGLFVEAHSWVHAGYGWELIDYCTGSPYDCGLLNDCDFTPTIVGDTIICSGHSTTLETQAYDSYQWYYRWEGSGQSMPLPGATGQSVHIPDTLAYSYISVEVSQDTCTTRSAEVLIEELVPIPPEHHVYGDIDSMPALNEVFVCEGDTVYIDLTAYDTLITWYRDGDLLGENTAPLTVTEGGFYFAESGIYSGCSYDSVETIDYEVQIHYRQCTLAMSDIPLFTTVNLYPNPSSDQINLDCTDALLKELTIYDPLGRRILHQEISTNSQTVDVRDWPHGTYFILVRTEERLEAGKLEVN